MARRIPELNRHDAEEPGLDRAPKNRTSPYRTPTGMNAMHSLRKDQGTMFAYGQPKPDAVIVNRVLGGMV